MSVTTYFDTGSNWGARIKNALKTFFNNLIEAREAEARRLVAAHVALYETSQLREKNKSRKAASASSGLSYRM